MVELVNVRATLARIGFNDVTRQEIIDNGFDSISSLLLVSEDEITDLAKYIGRWSEKPDPSAARTRDNVVNIIFLSLRKLVPMRKWDLVQTEKGIVPDAVNYSNQKIVRMSERIKFEESARKAAKDLDDPKPAELKNTTTKLRHWQNTLTANLEQDIGARGIPKIYLLRESTDVTPEMRDTTYPDTNVEYINTFKMSGPSFDADNKALYKDLKQQLIGTSASTFLKEHSHTQDGRAALMAVKAQTEGQANIRQRKSETLCDDCRCEVPQSEQELFLR